LPSIVVAVVGDSISAGSPLWDPDPAVRARIAAPDERSQWQWWAARADPRLEFRTSAVYGERTDEIAARLDRVLDGAAVLVVQGGVNDVAQGLAVEQAARNLAGMVERGARACRSPWRTCSPGTTATSGQPTTSSGSTR
jgi:hypothetical protein